MTDTTTKDLVNLQNTLRDMARSRKKQAALCYADGGSETDYALEEMPEWQAADTIERLTASVPADGDLREMMDDILRDQLKRPALLPARTPEPDALGEYAEDRSKECDDHRRRFRAKLLEIGDDDLKSLYYKTNALSEYQAVRHALLRTPAGRPDREAVVDAAAGDILDDWFADRHRADPEFLAEAKRHIARAVLNRAALYPAAPSEAEAVREALRPFAALGGKQDGIAPAYHDCPDDLVIYQNSGECITAGDVRKARIALGSLIDLKPAPPRHASKEAAGK